jgi:glycerophosphoryl diester phosphodiesterase
MENVNWCIENNASMDGYYPLMSQEIIDTLRNNELSSNAWTVNKQEVSEKLKEMKVDFITSDLINK